MENILNNITDEITIESATEITEEYQQIISTYNVMSKVIESITEPTGITTESGVNTFDNYVIEQLATVGLTKEYFGFEEELTIEAAQVTIEVNEKWTKLWEWLKAKIVQLKDWIVKVYGALFNKNKTLLKTISDLENIKLNTKVQTSIDNKEFAIFLTYLPDFSKSLLSYATGLQSNFVTYSKIIEIIIKNGKDLPKCANELRSSSIFRNVSEVANVLGHRVYSVKGVLVNVYNEKAKYITMDGSIANKIINDTYTISSFATISGKSDTLEASTIKFVLGTLRAIAVALEVDMSTESKKLESILTIYSDSIKLSHGESYGDSLKAIVELILNRQTNISFTVGEVTKLVKATALHIKCYK